MKVGVGVVGVTVLVTLFGIVQSAPGILSDLFSFENKFGPPPTHYRTVYVVKPPPGHHGPPKHSSKPSFSLSPFSLFSSKPSGYSSGSGWGSSGKRKPSVQTVDEQTYKTLVMAEPEHESNAEVMDDMDMIQNPQPEGEDPNSQVEVVRRPSRPQTQSQPQSMRGMRQHTMSAQSQSQRRPASTSSLRNQLSSRPTTFKGYPQAQTEDMSEMGMAEEDEMMGQVRGTMSSTSSSSGKKRPGKYSSGSGSSSSGWSSGPKTVTYVSSGWGPSSSSGGGWAWGPPPSHGWPATFDADDYWPLGFGGGSSSGGWGGSGWEPGAPGSGSESEPEGPGEEEGNPGPGETPEQEMEMEAPTPVEETGTTEEGEDRRPVRPRPRPSFSNAGSTGSSRPTTASRPRPTSSATASTSGRRPASAPTGGYDQRPNTASGSTPSRPRTPATNMIIPSMNAIKRPPARRPNLPSTSDPLPDDVDNMVAVDEGSGGARANQLGKQVTIAGQVVNNQDGLLDDELIRTVQQIIQQFYRSNS